mmetsp:Transcript_1762/g.3716  ORF Transcript_1762/g.3716 Transcript_1762/m.3716 type:complete len:90 (+) Transcript_1762:145-414(+)
MRISFTIVNPKWSRFLRESRTFFATSVHEDLAFARRRPSLVARSEVRLIMAGWGNSIDGARGSFLISVDYVTSVETCMRLQIISAIHLL